ncbi:ZZ-type zinc finger-containing protein 3 [Phlebotomus argentipes]|uniref:ZZ-type zinc finger-containing protein 3 n=1 Tax=Phlebotomus argentipes TaxID=94469 RepID=UPI0028929872|nr:ZZ-type zinc finger-containing protein 3 [Phlebotomus argentipes]
MASSNNVQESVEEEVEDFYFESEHLALKRNPDYHSLVKTIAILQAQQAQVVKDIDKLANMQVEALENPEEFVEKLRRGEDLGFPQRIKVATVPEIDMSKYQVQPPAVSSQEERENSVVEDEEESRLNSLKSSVAIRHWTVEEQKKLEKLLTEYPPEPVETRRFAKIARALGNRTTQQVASRCQKYFKKLRKVGLPIPGRNPKSVIRQSIAKMRCFNGVKSTFFPDLQVPVHMNEDDDEFWPQASSLKSSQEEDTSSRDEEKYITVDDTDDEEPHSSQAAIMKLAKRIQAEKKRDLEDRPTSLHTGYECNLCKEEPLQGTRWHCKMCEESTDYCTDCLFTQLMEPNLQHSLAHKFIALRVPPSTPQIR